MADESPPRQRRLRQFVDRSKAAKLYIDNYYANLLAKRLEREERYASQFGSPWTIVINNSYTNALVWTEYTLV